MADRFVPRPTDDMHLLLEYGAPKRARFHPDGHMGGGIAKPCSSSG